MSSRRGPLTNNPNVVNSPLRAAGASSLAAKQKRSHANMQREEAYGQPPPKKQAVEATVSQRAARSPSKLPRSQVLAQRGILAPSTTRTAAKERVSKPATAYKTSNQDEGVDKEVWKRHYRAKFPKMVFYFESIPDDIRAKLTKRVQYLGARQEPFFSIEVTHVITTRSIPTGRTDTQAAEPEVQEREPEEQPQTINPSLLDRNTAARRKLLFEFRNVTSRLHHVNDPTKASKGVRNSDVLHKAREMGKKIWSLEKFQTMVSVLLESETNSSQQSSRTTNSRTTSRSQGQTRGGHENNLLQLLQHERINGPTDRDLGVFNREATYFKGPYIYVFDMEERHKPMMVREYAKVANKADGDWPQFRSVGNGRCPFVDEEPQEREYRKLREQREQRREQERARAAATKPAVVTTVKAQDAAAAATRPVTGKRTLAEMEDGHNKVRAQAAGMLNPAKAALSKQTLQNAFTSRAEGGRVVHGEPVASGVQPSNITSAIRSQMISSQAGISAIKAGTSKEMHGLQRKVLQKTGPTSQEASSRRPVEHSLEGPSSRSTTLNRQASKAAQTQEEGGRQAAEGQEKRGQPESQPMKSKKDMKPGYCENCQDKFRDFDEHIVSRKHRKFAENTDNWGELDALLSKLKRSPKDFYMDVDYDL